MTSPQHLIEGFRRFREQHFTHDDALYRQLVAQGQTPRILVVACCDARVDPAIVLDCAPGDLFVIRNVANLVPPAGTLSGHHGTSSALEYGVRNLGVQHIIVLGHAHCGGIRTLVETGGATIRIHLLTTGCIWSKTRAQRWSGTCRTRRWMIGYKPASSAAILISLRNLMTFPWVRERVERKYAHVAGLVF